MNNIYLLFGLGNPGLKYQKTRHNIGQEFILWLQSQYQASPWRRDKKYFSQVSVIEMDHQKVIFALPLVYMNETGQAISKLIKYFNVPLKNIIVCHDDNDIYVGDFKLSFNYGSAGHKGVDSLIKSLKSQNFSRLRIGIQPKETIRIKAGDLVLKKFSPQERKMIFDTFPIMRQRIEKQFFD